MIELPQASKPLGADVEVPGSKSETNRVLVLAALAGAPSTVTGGLRCRDSDLMVAALQSLGVDIVQDETAWRVFPARQLRGSRIECGLAGTVMRFVPPVAALATGDSTFVGDPVASSRPMAGLLEALRQLGATVDNDSLPFQLTPGSQLTRDVTVDAAASSQFVSGLLLAAPRFPEGLVLRHVGDRLPSRPHIEMSVRMLQARGVNVRKLSPTSWEVPASPIQALDSRVEPDLTNAAVFLAAAAVAGGWVRIPAWPTDSLQPGALFLEVAQQMGIGIDITPEGVTARGTGELRAVDVDLQAASELTPVVAALAALAAGTTTIRGVAHIRGHETDRLRALRVEFEKLGVDVVETADGLQIVGNPKLQKAASEPFETYADHRMAHAAAILGLRLQGLSVTDLQCVSKTMPQFPQHWDRLVTG